MKNLKDNEYSSPIKIGNNFLILKLNEVRKQTIKIDKQAELNKMIVAERTKQLDKFSNIFYNKIKLNTKIVNFKPILIVPGEPKSIFFEIFFKSLKLTKIKSPLIIICNKKILLKEIKKFNFSKKIEELNKVKIDRKNIKRKKIYFVNISNNNPNIYVKKCFEFAFSLLKKNLTNKLVNGPINKTQTLKRKYLGMTEYISHSFKQKNLLC